MNPIGVRVQLPTHPQGAPHTRKVPIRVVVAHDVVSASAFIGWERCYAARNVEARQAKTVSKNRGFGILVWPHAGCFLLRGAWRLLLPSRGVRLHAALVYALNRKETSHAFPR